MAHQVRLYRIRVVLKIRKSVSLHAFHAPVVYAVLCEANGRGFDIKAAIPDGMMLNTPEQCRTELREGDEYAFGFSLLAGSEQEGNSRISAIISGLHSHGENGQRGTTSELRPDVLRFQILAADNPEQRLVIAKSLIAAKINNYAVLSEHTNGSPPDPTTAGSLRQLEQRVHAALTVEELLEQEGFPPAIGILRRERSGHLALASDMQEPFRNLMERAMIEASRQLNHGDFIKASGGPYRLVIRPHATKRLLAAVYRLLALPVAAADGSEPAEYRLQIVRTIRSLRRFVSGAESQFAPFRQTAKDVP